MEEVPKSLEKLVAALHPYAEKKPLQAAMVHGFAYYKLRGGWQAVFAVERMKNDKERITMQLYDSRRIGSELYDLKDTDHNKLQGILNAKNI